MTNAYGVRLTVVASCLAFVLGCMGLWGSGPVDGVRYRLALTGSELDETKHAVAQVLRARFASVDRADISVRVTERGVSVFVPRLKESWSPVRMFVLGQMTVHRVDELQTSGSGRVLEQTIQRASMSLASPPEKLEELLVQQNLLAADRVVFMDVLADGREQLVVTQRVPFVRKKLVRSAVWNPTPKGCRVESTLSDRMKDVFGDTRVGDPRDRVVLMLDGELLDVRPMASMTNEEGMFSLRIEPNSSVGPQSKGGRQVWSTVVEGMDKEMRARWCMEMAGVLGGGPLPVALRVEDVESVNESTATL